MSSKRIRVTVVPYIILLVLLSLVCAYALGKQSQSQNKSNPASYRVLKDDMGTRIIIGVEPQLDEGQLRATLIQAANDHQNDPARDLLISDYLWVEAYLVKGEKQSTVPAGRLRRYVPNPGQDDNGWLSWLSGAIGGKKDKFFITLDEARRDSFGL